MIEVREKYISRPDVLGGNGHGLCFSDGKEYRVSRCIIDLSAWPPRAIDEAVAVTWGSAASFEDCVIIGGGKHILIGSGDKEKAAQEKGCGVLFSRCIIENFCRRGPEVQSGMKVLLRDCLIRNWGAVDRWHERAFAGWAHHGGYIRAENCVFEQEQIWPGLCNYLADKYNHITTAAGYDWRSLVAPMTYMAGTRRGLTATHGGIAESKCCYATDPRIYVEGMTPENSMPRAEAMRLRAELLEMQAALMAEVCAA